VEDDAEAGVVRIQVVPRDAERLRVVRIGKGENGVEEAIGGMLEDNLELGNGGFDVGGHFGGFLSGNGGYVAFRRNLS
jgi:hypothetical protein